MVQAETSLEGRFREVAHLYAQNANKERGLAVRCSTLADEMVAQAAEQLAKAEQVRRTFLVGPILAGVYRFTARETTNDAEALRERSILFRQKARDTIEQGRKALDDSYQVRAKGL